MTQSTLQSRQSERGFTLVELAIVMIIIGLLIGGILKGQELINNARVSSTAAQAKAIESGISTFRDKYAGLPGDLANPLVRLPVVAGGTAAAGGFPHHHGAGEFAGGEPGDNGRDRGNAAGALARPHRRHQRNDLIEFAGTDAHHFAVRSQS